MDTHLRPYSSIPAQIPSSIPSCRFSRALEVADFSLSKKLVVDLWHSSRCCPIHITFPWCAPSGLRKQGMGYIYLPIIGNLMSEFLAGTPLLLQLRVVHSFVVNSFYPRSRIQKISRACASPTQWLPGAFRQRQRMPN